MKMLRSLLALLFLLTSQVAQAQVLPAINQGAQAGQHLGLQTAADLNLSLGLCWSQAGGYQQCANYLPTTRAQTVNSYGTWRDGHLSPFPANVVRFTDNGGLPEQASTNQALQSRDMTQAAWVKVTMTVALTATGIDNVANSASTLTATGASATILQTLTITSQAETYSVYCRRISGTGTINITENGGTNWTPITLTTAYQRFSVEATLANPVIGIQIVTNGDSIACDFNQDEELAFATSPIPTTTVAVARNADVITLTGAALTAALNAKAARVVTNAIMQTGQSSFVTFSGGAQLYTPNATEIGTYNGTTTLVATIGNSGTRTGLVKSAFGMDSTSYTAVANGGTKATQASAYANQTGTVDIGSFGGSSQFMNGYLPRLTFSPVKGAFDAMTTGSNPQ
jgi:hypothetical protein